MASGGILGRFVGLTILVAIAIAVFIGLRGQAVGGEVPVPTPASAVEVAREVEATHSGAKVEPIRTTDEGEPAAVTATVVKTVTDIVRKPSSFHWVGDGFPVRSMIDYNNRGKQLNPFILMDYAAPYHFDPHFKPRGVGFHPHRGFETVTVAYQGEVAHKDSHGGGGVISTDDVQWMTAASGLMHEEMHSQAFTDNGGTFEMVQLWVNLPAANKMVKPGYQELANASIPRTQLPDDAGVLRIVAGEFAGLQGPAKTHTPIGMYDVSLRAGKTVNIPVTPGWVALALVRRGKISVGGTVADEGDLPIFSRTEADLAITAAEDSGLLVLLAEPIEEPIVGYGPFVMNTQDEIQEAFADFQNGKFGEPV